MIVWILNAIDVQKPHDHGREGAAAMITSGLRQMPGALVARATRVVGDRAMGRARNRYAPGALRFSAS
jgi:hypothetical protein